VNPPVSDHPGDDSPLHQLDARVKIAGAVAFLVVVVTTPAHAVPAFAAYAALLVLAARLGRVAPRLLARRFSLAAPFVLGVAVFAPFTGDRATTVWAAAPGLAVTRAGLLVFWNVVAKALLGVVCASILTATTPPAHLFQGLEGLRVPRTPVMVLSLAWRYLRVLADEAARMKRARDARGYRGRWLWQASVVGRMVGTLFLRSYARAERVHLAMAARGYEGRFPAPPPRPLRATDGLFLAGTVAAACLCRWGLA